MVAELNSSALRILFVKERLAWPRSSGHDVHCFNCMRALGKLGHQIGLVTLEPCDSKAIEGANLARLECVRDTEKKHSNGQPTIKLSKWQEKFRSYWGIEPANIKRVGAIAEDFQADAVIVVGLNVLPYLGAVSRGVKIWYAADEWAWHHFSQVRWLRPSTWGEMKHAMVKGWYERSYAGLIDRVWMVSQADRQAIRWVAGIEEVDVMPNGVDAEHYQPRSRPEIPKSCVFWGRLDFGPNIQALEWFCKKVWPKVLRQVPEARFTIYGFQPGFAVRKCAKLPGVELVPDLPDLRDQIAEHQVVVLPFVSGGGIKNKLLEAAAQGKAILCSKRADRELTAGSALSRAESPSSWARELIALWQNEEGRRQLGELARAWVRRQHDWSAVARTAVAGITESMKNGLVK